MSSETPPNGGNTRLVVALYDGYDANAAPLDLSWGELVEMLSSAPEPQCAPKGVESVLPVCGGRDCVYKVGDGWSPVELLVPYRKNENVAALTAIVIDLDHITDEQLERVRTSVAEYTHAIHSTHSHAPPHDGCYRLVMALSRPATAKEWPAVRRALVELLELPADPSTKDLSRFYFSPTTREGVPFYFTAVDGIPVDVDDALAAAGPPPLAEPSLPKAAASTPSSSSPVPAAPVDLGALRDVLAAARRSKANGNDHAKEQADLLGRALEGRPLADIGGRHGARVRLTGLLAFHLPANTPWETALELVRPCLAATPIAEGETLEGAFEKTRLLYERAMQARIALDEKRAEENAKIKAIVDAVRSKNATQAAAEIGTGAPGEDANPDAWQEALLLSNQGVRGCEYNAHLLLTRASELQGALSWNEVTKRITVNDGPFAGAKEDALDSVVAGWLQRNYEFLGGARLMRPAILQVARMRSFDPIADMLREIAWDGQPRIDTFLETYFGADVCGEEGDAIDEEKQRYVRAVSRRWLISLVARALQPGCKVDNVLVLEGAQGVGKSRALEAIVGSTYFLDTALALGEKDTMQAIASAWLVELGELASFRRAEANRVKQFLSSKVDKFRPPYGAAIEESPRRCVFVGTTNDESYLHDRTGNRRYWCVRVFAPDPAAIARDRELLLAEAVAAYLAGERWWLEKSEAVLAESQAELRLDTSTTEEAIARWWYGEQPAKRLRRFTMLDVAELALHVQADRTDQKVRTEIGIAMKRLGFPYRQRSVGGARARYYEPTEALIEAPVQLSASRAATQSLVAIAKAKADGAADPRGAA